MTTLFSTRLYMLFGWHQGAGIQDAKIFGVFSSVEEANKVRDTYTTGNVIGFQLKWLTLDEEFVPLCESRDVYTVVRDGYRCEWRPATSADLIPRNADGEVVW
jgi:hypothetical protein